MKEPITPEKESVRKAYGAMCKENWTACIAATENWKKTGDELYRYGYDPNELFGYQNLPSSSSYKAKVAKTAEAMQQLGSRLAPLSAITRLLRPRTADPMLQARTQARSEFLNYTPTQTRYLQQRRQAVNDALCWGGGVLWTGLDERTMLPTSIWDPRVRTMVDANAKMYEDVRVIHRKRVRSKSETMRAYPAAAEILFRQKPYDAKGEYDEMKNASTDKDRICYYETWYNRGISQYSGGSEAYALAMGGGSNTEEDQRKLIMEGKNEPLLCLTTEDGELFWVGPWPIPFYDLPRDGWPCTFFDLYTGTVPTRPHSPLEAGLGIQRAINHLTTLMMANAKASFRATFVKRKQNGKSLSIQAADRVFNGADITVIEVDVGAVTDGKLLAKDLVEKIEWSKDFIAPGIQWLEYLDALYERLTPLSRFLNTGAGATQDRSAAATQVRDRNTLTRVEDMRDMISEADNTVSRKEAFTAALKLTSDDVRKTVPSAADAWGFLASTPEEKTPEHWIQQMSQGQEWIAQDPRVIEMAQQQAAAAFTKDEIIYGTDFEIEVSSSRRKDVDQQIESLNVDANSIWPLQLQSGDPRQMALAYDSMALRAKLQGMDPSIVSGMQQMAGQLRQQAMAPPQLPAPQQPI